MSADTFTVTRTTTVSAPPNAVYALLADFREWPKWSPWEELDPNMQRDYAGADSGEGAEYAWSGNKKAGKGHMRIVEATEPATVRILLTFEKPFKAENTTHFTISEHPSGSHVDWTMTGNKTIFTKVMALFGGMDKMIGKDFEKGLAKLKATAEQEHLG